jgi:hypothetical protein
MSKTKRVVPFKKPDSDTRSRIHEVGDGTTTPIKKLDKILNAGGARRLINQIKDQANGLRDLVYRFDVGEGYKALGYDSLRECFQEELSGDCDEFYLYRQLHAAKAERNLGGLLPMGKTVPERVLRPLHGLKSKQQRKAWKSACKATNKEIPTSTAIEEAIAKLSGKSSPQPAAKRTGSAKLSEKQQIEAAGKRIVANHDRKFVKALIKWLNQHLPSRRNTQPGKGKS